MGEAKRRQQKMQGTIYHHTSTLRTNLLWMSGKILTEDAVPKVLHPQLGEIGTDARLRRAMKDFPPLVWFTSRISVPRCLIDTAIYFRQQDGTERRVDLSRDVANAVSLNRVALGFSTDAIGAVPWRRHAGYGTTEGSELNETARDAGDDPDDWYVSEAAVDLMLMTEVWGSKSRFSPKLERSDKLLIDTKKLIAFCRSNPGVYVPPTWMSEEQARVLSAKLGIPVGALN